MKTEEQILEEIVHKAIQESNEDVVEASIELGYSKEIALKRAIAYRKIEIVKLLIKLGVDVNGYLDQVSSDNTAEDLAIAKLLLENGASVEDTLCWVNGMKMAKLLLSFGADVNGKRAWGADSFTFPLHNIVRENNIKLAEFFIKNGANLEERDSEGRTPLFIAYEENKFTMFRMLIKNGADITVTNIRGETLRDRWGISCEFRSFIRAEFQRIEDSLSVEEKERRAEIKRQEELEREREWENRQKELEEKERLRQVEAEERKLQEELAKLEAWKFEEEIEFQLKNKIAEIISRKKEMA
jgi:hypothetical protein